MLVLKNLPSLWKIGKAFHVNEYEQSVRIAIEANSKWPHLQVFVLI